MGGFLLGAFLTSLTVAGGTATYSAYKDGEMDGSLDELEDGLKEFVNDPKKRSETIDAFTASASNLAYDTGNFVRHPLDTTGKWFVNKVTNTENPVDSLVNQFTGNSSDTNSSIQGSNNDSWSIMDMALGALGVAGGGVGAKRLFQSVTGMGGETSTAGTLTMLAAAVVIFMNWDKIAPKLSQAWDKVAGNDGFDTPSPSSPTLSQKTSFELPPLQPM